MAHFRLLKRKYYFEAEDGNKILEMIPSDRNSFYELLEEGGRDSAKIEIIQAISQFFGGVEADSDSLPIWTGLRYNADGPPSAFVASQNIPDREFELLTPQLPEESRRLIEYEPDHVRLRLRKTSSQESPGIEVDLDLWVELAKIRRGVPSKYRDQVAERRLTRFLSRVAAATQRDERDFVRLRVRDLEDDRTYSFGVSLSPKCYYQLD
jgi:hypothetical protein